jgi:hypothetical protein
LGFIPALAVRGWKKRRGETRLLKVGVSSLRWRMMWRVVLVCAALLSMLATTALTAGEYQRTKDGKTLIWNADSKPGGSASWWGERDKEGYAKGVGELTWYTKQSTVYARYYGNMVHGKLDGPINVHVKARTAHAFFSDGKRMTGWARGPASSRFATDWRSAIAREKTGAPPEASPPPPSSEAVSAREELRSGAQQTEEGPAEGAVEEKKENVSATNPAEAANTERPTSNVERRTEDIASVEGARKKEDSGKTKSAPMNLAAREEKESRKAEENGQENAERQTSNAEQVTSPTAESESQRAANPGTAEENAKENVRRRTSNVEQSTREGSASTKENAERRTPKVEQSKSRTVESGSQSAGAHDHGSLAELAAPPAALRSEPVVETPSTAIEADLASAPSATARLTTDEAVTIGDSEARARGYELSQYQRPKADYSKVKGKWSLVYDLKNPETAEQNARQFRVIVDDASRKADVNP